MTKSQPLTHPLTSTAAPTVTGPMRHLQRAAGIAALLEGSTYLAGFGVMVTHLAPRGFTDAVSDPARSLTFLLQNQAVMYLWYLLIYLVAGAALVVLTLGIHDRLKHATPALSQVTTAFGLIWSGLLLASGMVALVGQRGAVELAVTDRSEAVSAWSSVSVAQDALGGGIEVVGALWVLLLSLAAIRTRLLPRGLGMLGILIGVAGMATLVPHLDDAGSVFGLGYIAWYLWAGLTLLRS